MRDSPTKKSERPSPVLAVGLIGAAFFYFLIFAQFALLERIEASGVDEGMTKLALGAMGAFGAGSSLAALALVRRVSLRLIVRVAFAGSALAALFAACPVGPSGFVAIAALVGLTLGPLTVGIASLLPRLMPSASLGAWTGVGVGIAYAASNLPWVFSAPAQFRCLAAALAALGGLAASWRIPKLPAGRREERNVAADDSSGVLFGPAGLAVVTSLFVALVWLDSAAFYLIQNTPSLKAASWAGTERLFAIALAHLLAAALAGRALDRGYLLLTLFAALALLVLGHSWLPRASGGVSWLPTLLYAVGVSFYSTALVAYPALGYQRSKRPSVVCRAGVLFAFAGWIASGLGIGMATDLGEVPGLFLVVCASGFAVVTGWLVARGKGNGRSEGSVA